MALRPPPAVRQDGRSGAFGPLRSRSARRRSATFGSFRSRSPARSARETSAPFGGLRGRTRLAPRPAPPARPGASRDPRSRETSARSGGRGREGVREASDGLGRDIPAQSGGARDSSEPLGERLGGGFGRLRLGGRAAPERLRHRPAVRSAARGAAGDPLPRPHSGWYKDSAAVICRHSCVSCSWNSSPCGRKLTLRANWHLWLPAFYRSSRL